MLEQVKQFINNLFIKGANKESTNHFERTVFWVKQLNSEADEPVLIAAYAHDAGRAISKQNVEEALKNRDFNDPEFLRGHQKEGADFVTVFLKKKNYNGESTSRIYNMIRHHEEGGSEDANLIMDADSISYLETNATRHIRLVNILGKDKIKRKIDWMYKRISSDKARELAEPFYNKAMASLLKFNEPS